MIIQAKLQLIHKQIHVVAYLSPASRKQKSCYERENEKQNNINQFGFTLVISPLV